MKNAIQYFLQVALITLSVAVFFSCNKKVDNPSPINLVDTTKSATITGIVYAELNTSNAEPERAPAGTKIKVVINSREYASTIVDTYQYQELTYSTTVASDGTYSIKVPALNKAIAATIIGDQFVANRQVNVGNTNPVRTVYNLTPTPVSVRADLTYYVDLQYGF